MPRIENWASELRKLIMWHKSMPFAWGDTEDGSDCMFWAGIVRALTGWDPIADGRGYTDAASARRALRDAGYKSALDLVEDRLVEISPADAMRGDLVYPAADFGPLASPFILDGPNAFSKCMAGPVIITRAECVRAFAY